MNILDLPKQEDKSATVVELTDENSSATLEVFMSMYLYDECMYCHLNFTKEELKTSIWAHPNRFGRIVHKECWDANNGG